MSKVVALTGNFGVPGTTREDFLKFLGVSPREAKKEAIHAIQKKAEEAVFKHLMILIKSKIMKIVLKVLMKKMVVSQYQMVQILEKEGFTTCSTQYKLRYYLSQLNERYDLPIGFTQSDIYLEKSKLM
jgi:hypothetical protein